MSNQGPTGPWQPPGPQPEPAPGDTEAYGLYGDTPPVQQPYGAQPTQAYDPAQGYDPTQTYGPPPTEAYPAQPPAQPTAVFGAQPPPPQPYGAPSPPPPPQPSYGAAPQPYAPQPPGAPGYQPSSAYAPGGYGGPYGAPPPKGGSGGKIAAIAVAAVVVVVLVIVAAVLVTKKDSGDKTAGKSTAAPSRASNTSTPPPLTPPPESTSPSTPPPVTQDISMTNDEALAAAERAFPGFSNTYDYCYASGEGLFVEVDLQLSCSGPGGKHIRIMMWRGSGSGYAQVRASFYGGGVTEPNWARGKDFVDSNSVYTQIIRCYSAVPVCVEAFQDTKAEADALINGLNYLDTPGIKDLQTWFAGQPF